MEQYSELIGSFIRTGDYPLEANYIFESEAALKEFYTQPINKTTLHKGLLKIVANDSEQSLYWVIERDSELQFEKLIDSVDIINLASQLEELKTHLDQHKEDYESLVSSVEDLQIAIDDLAEVVNEDINTLKALIGITDDQDILEYLNSLPYESLTSAYNALQEVKDFLKGYEEGETLKEVELNIKTLIRSLVHNLQTELDQTQIGVGLSGDGSYNSDKETNLLKDATSVMNALKTLDAALYQILDNPGTLLNTEQTNDIIVKDKGLFFSISTEYENGVLTVNVNGEPKYTHDLGLSAIVDDAYYDPNTEDIVIIFKLHSGEVQRVEIPADKLITEWDVEETATVSLNRERVVDGADILTANVKISQEANNSLQEKADGLFSTGGEAINILPNHTIDEFVIDYREDYGCYCILWRELDEALDRELVAEANSQNALMYMEDSDGSKYLVVESDLNGEIPLENFSFVYKGFLCNGKTKGYVVDLKFPSPAIVEDLNLSSRDFLFQNEFECIPVPEGFDHWLEVPVQLTIASSKNITYDLEFLEHTWDLLRITSPYKETPLDTYSFRYNTERNTLSWVENQQYDYEHGSKYYLTVDELNNDYSENLEEVVINNTVYGCTYTYKVLVDDLPISFENPKVYINDVEMQTVSVLNSGYWSGLILYNTNTWYVFTSQSEQSGKMWIQFVMVNCPIDDIYGGKIISIELCSFLRQRKEQLGQFIFNTQSLIPNPNIYSNLILDVGETSTGPTFYLYIQYNQNDGIFTITDQTHNIIYKCITCNSGNGIFGINVIEVEYKNTEAYLFLEETSSGNITSSGNLMSKEPQYMDEDKPFFNIYTGEGWIVWNNSDPLTLCFETIKDNQGHTLQLFPIKADGYNYEFSYYSPEGLTTCHCLLERDPHDLTQRIPQIKITKLKSPAVLEIVSQEEFDALENKDSITLYIVD